MAVIDLKEIPEAHIADGDQDRFELFARDFLEALGFRIIQGPGRGADRGRDLLVGEAIGGTVTATERIWLVSAKHKAHSGRSVSDGDEIDPIGRVRRFRADGFMPFYSTLPSSGLDDTLGRITSDVAVYTWDSGRIAQRLASDSRLLPVLATYLPDSLARMRAEAPANIFAESARLDCNYCGRSLHTEAGLVAFVKAKDADGNWVTTDLYWSCRGACDQAMSSRLPPGQITAWEGLDDLRIPIMYLKYIMVTLNNLRSGSDKYSDVAFEKEKHLLLAMAQNVVREATPAQKERIRDLAGLPDWLGGLAYE